MEYHDVPQIGWAQFNWPDFEEKEVFEISYAIRILREIRWKSVHWAKKTKLKIKRNPYDDRSYKTIQLINDGLSEDSFIRLANEVDSYDWEEMDTNVKNAYEALNEALDNDMGKTAKSLELSYSEVALIKGYSSFGDMLKRIMNDDLAVVPSSCPLACETEPDGKCSHGYESIILKLNLI